MAIIYTIFNQQNIHGNYLYNILFNQQNNHGNYIYTIFSVNSKATGIKLAILHHILPAIVFLNSENEKV